MYSVVPCALKEKSLRQTVSLTFNDIDTLSNIDLTRYLLELVSVRTKTGVLRLL